MRRVLTKRRRQRRLWWLVATLNLVSAIAMVATDEPTMWTVAAAAINGAAFGGYVFLIWCTGHLDFLRKSRADRHRWLRQAFRINRSLLATIKSSNETNASLVDHVRRYRALVTGPAAADAAAKEWKH